MARLRIRDSRDGAVVLDIYDRLTAVLGQVNSGSVAGSVAVPEFATRPGWAAVIEGLNPNGNLFSRPRTPIVTVTSTGFQWIFTQQSIEPILPCTIIYGIY